MEVSWESPESVMSSLFTLYKHGQTSDEKASRSTSHQNHVGFNALDAPILSSFCEQLERTGNLTQKQFSLVQELLPKYKEQIALLQGSILPFTIGTRVNAPPQKNSGVLKLVGNKLQFIPNIYPSAQIKSLGFIWNSSIKGWIGYPSEAVIDGVQRMFDDVVLDPTVEEFLIEQRKELELSENITESPLFPYQKEASAFELKHRKTLLGLAPGTGKSASAIFSANELNKQKILVICPLTLTYMWQKQIKQWIGKNSVIWHGNISTWTSYDQWVITNYDTVVRNRQDIINQGFEIIIMDESIMLKNRQALRSQAMKEVASTAEYVWLLSGSPSTKFYDDMWMQLHIINPQRFRSYWKFVENYCVVEVNRWGQQVIGNQPDATQRLKRDLADIYFSRTMDEVLDIPDWIFDTVPVPMSKVQYKLYEQMENEFLADLPDGDQLLAPNVLSQMLRLMQFASNPLLLDGPDDGAKWKALEELIELEEKPVIIWTNFIRTAQEIHTKLSKKYSCAVMVGQTSNDQRDEIVQRFQNGDIEVLIAHPAVGKFGLTLTRARTAIYLERSFNGDDYYQSLYRVRRIGTKYSPHIINMVAIRPDGKEGNTIDGVIDRVLDYRKNSSIAITSGLIRDNLGK